MDFKELKKVSVAELVKLLAKYREQLRDLRFSISAKQQKNIRQIREPKQMIARILTLLNNHKADESTDQTVAGDNLNK
ncbi:MAG: 50S ribosomal protein L29 [Patescibacteria group bacterium]|jgi:ribosomal protein L29